MGSEILLSTPDCYTASSAATIQWLILRPCGGGRMSGGVIVWPHHREADRSACVAVLSNLPWTDTVCLNCSGTKSWQGWDDLIEKRDVTSASYSGIPAAATVPASWRGLPPAHVLCPRNIISRSPAQLGYKQWVAPEALSLTTYFGKEKRSPISEPGQLY